MLTVTLIDVEFPSATAYFPSSSEDIQSTNSRCRLKKHLTLFFISVFFLNSIKVFYFMFHVNASIVQFLFVFWQSSHTRTWLPFTVSLFIAHATLFQWCINDLVHSEFPVSDLPCWTVLTMISATVTGLRSLEGDVFRQFLTQKNAKHFSISDIRLATSQPLYRRTANDHGDKAQA